MTSEFSIDFFFGKLIKFLKERAKGFELQESSIDVRKFKRLIFTFGTCEHYLVFKLYSFEETQAEPPASGLKLLVYPVPTDESLDKIEFPVSDFYKRIELNTKDLRLTLKNPQNLKETEISFSIRLTNNKFVIAEEITKTLTEHGLENVRTLMIETF